jgi:hypothetical protein
MGLMSMARAVSARGSAWRTIGYVARPPAAPGDDGACACTPLGAHPLLCGMARSISRCALALRRLPGWGRFSCASAARSLLRGNDRRESGRQGRTAGLRQPHPRALRVARTALTSQRGPQRRAIAIRPDQRQRLLFQANLLRFRVFGLTRARTPARAIGVKKQKIGK